MPTNLAIDDKLLNEALRIGGFHSKKETVNRALQAFISSQKRKGILEFKGKVEFDSDYDYKQERKRR